VKPFVLALPRDRDEALSLVGPDARPRGGGMDLLDLAKRGVSCPGTWVDLRRVAGLDGIAAADVEDTVVGARTTLAAIAASERLRARHPALSDAAASAATPQVRAVATLAGNLLQAPRCAYYRDPFFDCLRRGGTTCPSREGEHREGAVLGNGACCAAFGSNLGPALVALGATIRLASAAGEPGQPARVRDLDVAALFPAPAAGAARASALEPGEVAVEVRIAPAPASAYVEVNFKQSFDWAAASCAASLSLAGGKVASARLVLGAAAPVPWRAEAAEAALVGGAPDEAAARAAATAAVKDATPLPRNRHKVKLLEVAVRRAVLAAAARGR
jgi:xanthine dehydrogenase YagS FAD-binding subunit